MKENLLSNVAIIFTKISDTVKFYSKRGNIFFVEIPARKNSDRRS